MHPSQLSSPSVTNNRAKRPATEPPEESIAMDSKLDELARRFNETQRDQLAKIKDVVSSENEILLSKFKSEIKAEIGSVRLEQQKMANDLLNVRDMHRSLSSDLNNLKQEKLNSVMEISGVSSALLNAQSAADVFATLMTSFNISVPATSVTRIFSRDITIDSLKKKLLVVEFHDYDAKLAVMIAKQNFEKDKKPSIYFNHALTPQNRSIYNKAKDVARELKRKVKVARGRIYICKFGEKKGEHIKSIEAAAEFLKKTKDTVDTPNSTAAAMSTSDKTQ